MKALSQKTSRTPIPKRRGEEFNKFKLLTEGENGIFVFPYLVLEELLKPGTTPEKMEEVNTAVLQMKEMMINGSYNLGIALSKRATASAFVRSPGIFVEKTREAVENGDVSPEKLSSIFQKLASE